MNKTILILSMLMLLLISMTFANVENDNSVNLINDLIKQNTLLKQENTQLKHALLFSFDNCIFREVGKQYIVLDENISISSLFQPVIKHHSSSSSTTCSECQDKPQCYFPYYKYKDDGTDSCGCAINPRCVPNKTIVPINNREI